MVDFVVPLATANASGTLNIPYAFNSWALNRFLWVNIATCHDTNGVSADPVQDAFQDGQQMFNYRIGEKTTEGGKPPVRDYLYLTDPAQTTALSGTVSVQLRAGFSATPSHVVVHVVGITGAQSPWKRDDALGTGTDTVPIGVIAFGDPYGGFAGAAARGNPTPPVLTAGAGVLQKLGDAVAGAPGEGSVRGTVWLCDTSSTWTVAASFSSFLAGTGFSLRGGLPAGEAPAPPEPTNALQADWEKRWWMFGHVQPHFAEEEDCR